MKTAAEKAFTLHVPDRDAEGVVQEGLTKREYFAAHAPSPPCWFEYKSRLAPPKEPKDWQTIGYEEHREQCRNWQHDPSYDLPEELKWYQEAWESYQSKKIDYEFAKRSEYYFAWSVYYADELIKQLDKLQSPTG